MKNVVKGLIALLVVAILSVGLFFVLKSCGVTDIESLREIIASCGAWGWIVYILLFTTCSILLCFIPASSMTFIGVSIVLFGAFNGFIISAVSVFLSSSIMFMLGHTLGEKVAVKLVGKEALEKAQSLVDMKSKMLLPLMFLFPVFPDDALCLVSGMTKMKYWYFAIIVAICRSIGVASICFVGSGIINWAELSLVDWFVLGSVCVFWIYMIFKYQHKIEKFIVRKRKPKQKVKVVDKKIDKEKQLQIIKNLERGIARREETIKQLKYCGDEQLQNIQRTLERLYKLKERAEKKLLIPDVKSDLQKIVCDEISATMKAYFPDVKYEIKRSNTTASIYLTLYSDCGAAKTIRFSDHNSKKFSTKYTHCEAVSRKQTKRIIEKNLKCLKQKSVYVLLDKLKEEQGCG